MKNTSTSIPDMEISGTFSLSWKIKSPLVDFSFFRVYPARDIWDCWDEHKYMVKVAKNNPASEELDILTSIKHHNIVQLIDHHCNLEYEQFVMKHDGSINLTRFHRNFMREQKVKKESPLLPFHCIGRVITQVLDALSYLHSNEIAHQNLYPGHVLVDPTDYLKVTLVGFGHAKKVGGGKLPQVKDKKSIQYKAPEVFDGKHDPFKADVWALGVIIMELLAKGSLPYPMRNGRPVLPSLTARVWHAKCVPRLGMPYSLHKLLKRALSQVPELRWSAGALLRSDWPMLYAPPETQRAYRFMQERREEEARKLINFVPEIVLPNIKTTTKTVQKSISIHMSPNATVSSVPAPEEIAQSTPHVARVPSFGNLSPNATESSVPTPGKVAQSTAPVVRVPSFGHLSPNATDTSVPASEEIVQLTPPASRVPSFGHLSPNDTETSVPAPEEIAQSTPHVVRVPSFGHLSPITTDPSVPAAEEIAQSTPPASRVPSFGHLSPNAIETSVPDPEEIAQSTPPASRVPSFGHLSSNAVQTTDQHLGELGESTPHVVRAQSFENLPPNAIQTTDQPFGELGESTPHVVRAQSFENLPPNAIQTTDEPLGELGKPTLPVSRVQSFENLPPNAVQTTDRLSGDLEEATRPASHAQLADHISTYSTILSGYGFDEKFPPDILISSICKGIKYLKSLLNQLWQSSNSPRQPPTAISAIVHPVVASQAPVASQRVTRRLASDERQATVYNLLAETVYLTTDSGLAAETPNTSTRTSHSNPKPSGILTIAERYIFPAFTPLKLLGQGSFGAVFLVAEKHVEKNYVVKVQRMEKGEPTQEAKIITQLDHPNIVKCLGIECGDGVENIIMPYLDNGVDLRAYLEQKGIYRDNKHILRQVAAGIEYLHDLDIVHLDIKAENVIISNHVQPHATLIDFGLAFRVNELHPFAGDKFGTLSYAAPELIENGITQEHAKCADIWSFGVTIFYAENGCMPFQLVDWHLPFPQGDVYLTRPLSRDLTSLLNRCLEKDPRKRATIHEVAASQWMA